MLTVKDNLRETLKKDGHPDRFVNQYEFLHLVVSPHIMLNPRPAKGGPDVADSWGVTRSFPANVPGAFPVHTPDKVLIKDIEHWQDYLKKPATRNLPEELWAKTQAMADSCDKSQQFVAAMIAPGIFEQCHNFLEITNCLMAFYEYPDEMHDIIKVITEYELEVADEICSRIHPDGLFHHDDWGSQQSTFISPAMFDDFFLDAYKQVYGYYHDHGVEVIVHHSDSYAATLVPEMIEMGINVWQGAMSTNNIPEVLKKYEGQIGIMAGIDSAWVDNPEHTDENTRAVVRRELEKYTPHSFIPCITMGGAESTFPGVYDTASDEIAKYNQEKFGVSSNYNHK